ncbi:MAG: hypothetical protein ACRCYP_00065 [Alphaproteobacteria bacterium]
MLKKLLLGICVGVSFPLFSVYAATVTDCQKKCAGISSVEERQKCEAACVGIPTAECLKDCGRNKSTTREDLQKCEAGCQDGGDSISVSTSGANADIGGRSIRKTNPSGNRN